jgi:hypothetical protein
VEVSGENCVKMFIVCVKGSKGTHMEQWFRLQLVYYTVLGVKSAYLNQPAIVQ